jgi:DNA helicase-2/ATP-dependent DNA helicase PcrA
MSASPAKRNPSPQQRAILDYLKSSSGHVVIHATAGAGKTTTLVQIAQAQPPDTRSLFLAFARDAAQELQHRLGASTSARTVHSLGREVLGRELRQRDTRLDQPQAHKYRQLTRTQLRQHAPKLATPDNEQYLNDLSNFVRLNLADPADPGKLADIATSYDLWPPLPAVTTRLHQLLPAIIRRGMELGLQGSVDFTDMIYLPTACNLTLPAFDLVCVDEAQDYSPAALELTLRLAERGARLVFVGDPRQTIFGFAGASSTAMERISSRTNARILPLAVSYRCPRLHVELARRIAPEMEAAPDASAGSVNVIADSELEAWVQHGDLVLCRVNAPLLAACLRIARLGIPCTVRGVNLAARLLTLSQKALGSHPGNFERQLQRYQRKEEARLRKELPGRGEAAPLQARLHDELACLSHLCRDLDSRGQLHAAALAERISSVFTQQADSVIFSTIHRAKGQEAERVILLYPELLPAPYARSSEALRAEACIQFVALTRSKRDLVLVEQPLPAGMPPRQPETGTEAPPVPTAGDDERDRVISNWNQILLAARSGRRHRPASQTSRIKPVREASTAPLLRATSQ